MTRPLLLALAAAPALAFGTAQVPERLTYEGVERAMFSTPLEDYFRLHPPRPEWLTETHTACFRGYVASWEIVDGALFLKRVEKGDHERPTDFTKRLFPKEPMPLKATWFTGTIQVPLGKVLDYVHQGFASVHEKDLFLSVEKGVIVKTRIVDNRRKPRPFRKSKVP